MKLFNAMLLVALLILASFRPASAVTEQASVGYCEGANRGAVTLTLNGISQASAQGLQPDADAPDWLYGVGKVDYNGYGVSIKDDAAEFRVHLIDSPALPGTNCLIMVPKLIDSVEILGSKAGGRYHITTELPMTTNEFGRCPSVSMVAQIDPQPRALGLLKRSFSTK